MLLGPKILLPLCLAISMVLSMHSVLAHGGKLDKNGCHNNFTTTATDNKQQGYKKLSPPGPYHCHSGDEQGQQFVSKKDLENYRIYKQSLSFWSKNTTQSYKNCLNSAESGNRWCQYLVGYYYFQKGNNEDGLNWLNLSAKQKNPLAFSQLGKYYDTNKKYKEAASWFQKAARQGHKQSQLRLGEILLNQEKPRRGRFWLKKYYLEKKWSEFHNIPPTPPAHTVRKTETAEKLPKNLFTRTVKKKKVTINQKSNRLALIIGNSKYQKQFQLRNAVSDASRLAATLKKYSFEVDLVKNVSLLKFKKAVKQFGDKLKHIEPDPDAAGLFFYSGHANQDNFAQNHMIPVDTDVLDFGKNTVNLEDIKTAIGKLKSGTGIILLDACRLPPQRLTSVQKALVPLGLATISAPTQTIIGFSTRPGRFASDGKGGISPYTQALINNIEKYHQNHTIVEILQKVTGAVRAQTDNEQVPIFESEISRPFYFTSINQKTTH